MQYLKVAPLISLVNDDGVRALELLAHSVQGLLLHIFKVAVDQFLYNQHRRLLNPYLDS